MNDAERVRITAAVLAAVLAAVVVAVTGSPSVARAQAGPSPGSVTTDAGTAGLPGRWRLFAETGGSIGGTWLDGERAPRVYSGAGFLFGVGAQRELTAARARPMLGVAARADVQPLRLTESGKAWSGGTLTGYDVVATFGVAAPAPPGVRLRLQTGAGIAILTGGSSTLPFSDGSVIAPRLEASVTVASAASEGTRRDLALVLRAGAMHLAPTDAVVALSPGWARRLSLALRITR